MYRIAIVEDVQSETTNLITLLQRYMCETEIELTISSFANGSDFLDYYPDDCDIVLMDIQMEPMDGMETARRLREFNEDVILIFVTNMAQYALQGYEVEALDFLVKPVKYQMIWRLLNKVFSRLQRKAKEKMSLKTGEGTVLASPSDIRYVESYNHKVIVHCAEKAVQSSETMQSVEEKLRGYPFFRCHVAYLVNLDQVERVQGNNAWIGGIPIPISKHRRKDFLDALTAFLGDKI